MDKQLLNKKGFSLLEVVIAMLLLTIVWLASVGVIFISKATASHAKHKVQAIYVIQQIIEDMRKQPFGSLRSYASTKYNGHTVSIDTRGTPNNTADDLMATPTVTVPSSPTDPGGYYTQVLVSLTWTESLLGKSKQVTESFGTYIANDSQAN
jgi:uncharacterized protein (TIGR02598 family)